MDRPAHDIEPSLGTLHRRFRPALMAYFLRRVASHADAEDLTQEVFLRIARTDMGPLDSTEGYLFKVAANLLRDRARRSKIRTENRFAVWTLEGGGVEHLDPARITADRESISLLASALRDLKEPTRSIFVLYRLENVDRRALGQAYSLSRHQIDRHITMALDFLQSRVRGDEG